MNRIIILLLSSLCAISAWAQKPAYYRLEYALFQQWATPSSDNIDGRLTQYLPIPKGSMSPTLTAHFLHDNITRVLSEHPHSLLGEGGYVLDLNTCQKHPCELSLTVSLDPSTPPIVVGRLSIQKQRYLDTQWWLHHPNDASIYIHQSRRTRSGIINYLDHPRMGILFGCWPVDHPPVHMEPADEETRDESTDDEHQ